MMNNIILHNKLYCTYEILEHCKTRKFKKKIQKKIKKKNKKIGRGRIFTAAPA